MPTFKEYIKYKNISFDSIEIDIRNKDLTDLEGIENFVNLEYLNIFNNKITKIDLSKNIKLKKINCSKNKLSKIDLSNNKKLERLYIIYNNLQHLELKNCLKLKYLNCSNNKLSKIDVSYNKNLFILNCSNNKLSSINISQNLLLYELDITYNNKTKDIIINNQINHIYYWNTKLEYIIKEKLDIQKEDIGIEELKKYYTYLHRKKVLTLIKQHGII